MPSIRTKISLITMIAILVSVLLTGGVGILFIRSEGERSSDQEMTLMCDAKRKNLNEYLKSIEQSVDIAARYATEEMSGDVLVAGGVVGVQGYGAAMTGMRDWDSSRQKELDAYLKEHVDKVEAVFRNAANYTTGISSYYYCLNPELSKKYSGFLFTRDGTEQFSRQTMDSVFSYSMDDISHVGWYSLPLQRGGPSWLEPYFNANLNETMISYVVPIYKADTFIGVIGMDIGYKTLVSQIDSIKIYETGYACLVDAEGVVIYHPHLESGVRVDNVVPVIAESANNPVVDKNDVCIFRYQFDGVEKKAVSCSLENGLRLMIMAPAMEIGESWYEMIKSFFFIGGAILLVFSIVTMLATQRIIEPLQTLTAASQRITEGDYELKLEYDGNDEVGILTKSFQQLVEHLKVYINDLNSKAYKDALTHVKNKGAFEMQLNKIDDLITSGEDEKLVEFAIVMFDCNYLKNINDQYGHVHGDTYLRTGCMFICKTFAHSPVFRIGGDEFAAILQGDDYQNWEALFAQFDERMEECNAVTENPWEKINISKGIAVYDPEKDANAESVLERADDEMYREKVRMKTVRTD